MAVATVTGNDGDTVELDEGGRFESVAMRASAPGDDSPPLPGDSAVVVAGTGKGARIAVAFLDNLVESSAAPGERILYSRNALGLVTGKIHLKGDGKCEVTAPGGFVLVGDLEVQGSVKVLGEVEALEVTAGATPSAAVTLSKHTHPAPGGATSPPNPGT